MQDHDRVTKRCTKCSKCTGLVSTWSCSCGQQYHEHTTKIETRAERIQNGRATSEVEQILNDNMLHGPIGGNVQNFMDLVDGSERFGAQVEEYEQKQLEYQHRNAIDLAGSRNNSKMLKNGLNILGGPQESTKNRQIEHGGGTKGKDMANKGNKSQVATIAQRQLESMEQTPSALMLFKKPHKYGR